MKIDLDNCCFNRPFDDQSYMKNININVTTSYEELYSVLRMLQKKIDDHEIDIINNPYDEFCTKVPLSDFLNEKIKPEFIRMYFKDFEQNQLYFLEADIYMCYGALRKIDSLKMEYVIFTCDSYVDISKSGFLYPWNQCPQSTLSYEPKLLLGEVYRISQFIHNSPENVMIVSNKNREEIIMANCKQVDHKQDYESFDFILLCTDNT